MTVVEAMVAEIDGWDDDLRVILPQRSISGTGFWRPTSRSSSAPDCRVLRGRGRCPATPKLVSGPWA